MQTAEGQQQREPSPLRLAIGVAETALRLGVSQSHIRNLISRGELPASRIGGRIIVRLTALDAYLEANAVRPTEVR